MDTSTLFSIAPTFPLDDARIRSRSRAKMIQSPFTWGSLIATGLSGFALGAGFTGFVALYALAAFGLRKFWEKRRPAVDAASLRELIGESNAAQDEELLRIIGQLESCGLPQYSLCVGRFLFLKRKVEGALHQGAHLAGFAPEIEKGVDGICAEVCREITSLRERESALGEVLTSRNQEALDRLETARRESHAAILHAYTSLYQTHAELVGFDSVRLQATSLPGAIDPSKCLSQIVGNLRDEADLVARAHARIRASLEEIPPAMENPMTPRSMESV